MTSRGYAQNHSKKVSRARLPVRYCIMVTANAISASGSPGILSSWVRITNCVDIRQDVAANYKKYDRRNSYTKINSKKLTINGLFTATRITVVLNLKRDTENSFLSILKNFY